MAYMTSTIEFERGFPAGPSAAIAHREQDWRRALEAYHFFFPTVSMEAIARGTRAAGAADNKAALLVMAQPRHVGFTLNSDTPYAAGILDLRDSGLAGPDAGKGGRYLILPPGWDDPVPAGYTAAWSDTWVVLLALRALPLGGDLSAAVRLLTSVRVYPLGGGDRDGYAFTDGTA